MRISSKKNNYETVRDTYSDALRLYESGHLDESLKRCEIIYKIIIDDLDAFTIPSPLSGFVPSYIIDLMLKCKDKLAISNFSFKEEIKYFISRVEKDCGYESFNTRCAYFELCDKYMFINPNKDLLDIYSSYMDFAKNIYGENSEEFQHACMGMAWRLHAEVAEDERALKLLQHCLKINDSSGLPQTTKIYLCLTCVYHSLGRNDECLASYGKATSHLDDPYVPTDIKQAGLISACKACISVGKQQKIMEYINNGKKQADKLHNKDEVEQLARMRKHFQETGEINTFDNSLN